ncbi:SMP-30/gluconolactonase/LRE family protein [bacterium]|jgi:gluconolactonase|nr:SMP-30/gluconolactonase/LRE family protein [Verrucomicrobiales bacterium]MDB3940476.1 SMP-30/gluconolactonase/LRE family protein [Verrucomicrobiales bacterium]MDC0252240.1 SMP-30/gluconolactonase/LRE family protein [bacterium]
MKYLLSFLLLMGAVVSAQEEPYPFLPDMEKKDGVPAGEIRRGMYTDSAIFPGTTRDYAVYVPAQYDDKKPAALMVFQDGISYLKIVPIAFDNLIHAGDMPITIGLFVNPGVVPELDESSLARYNRSFEYDATDDRYARFLLEEMIPVALGELNITKDPNLRSLCGSSSGGIAAFVAAWNRPDQFRRIYATVGTFVGLRGGNELPVLVRKTEPKPLRIFLQDGRNDLDIYCGSWWVANQDMLSSLTWAGYEVNHEWGEGGHNRKHGNAIFPDVMRWLWKGWDENSTVRTHLDKSKSRAVDFLEDGNEWELVSEGHGFTEGPAINADGELFFTDLQGSKIWRIGQDGKEVLFQADTGSTNGLAFAPDGKTLYGCQRVPGRLVSWNIDSGEMTVHAEKVRPNDVVVAHDGTVYFTDPGKKTVWVIVPGEEAKVASNEFSGVNGVVLSPDQSLVYAADYGGRFVWSGQRKADGTLAFVQPYFHLHISPGSVDVKSHADGMAVSNDGWLLVATQMGIQICDQPGRVHLIIPSPVGERHPSNVTFNGKVLYATCGDKVFRRTVKLEGAQAWAAPVKPAKPRL